MNSTARSKFIDAASDMRSTHRSKTIRAYSSSRQENKIEDNDLKQDAYSVQEGNRRLHNKSVNIKKNMLDSIKLEHRNAELFKAVEEKVLSNLTSQEEQKQAMKRVDLLKKYIYRYNNYIDI